MDSSLRRNDKIFWSVLSVIGFFFTPLSASAQELALPDCIKTGDCKLEDIVKTGAAFANLITQLSAAFFFAAFIYGGAMYLLSFGDKSRVEKGKKAITGSAIGMAIVLMAWTIVNYIYGALTGAIGEPPAGGAP